MWLRTVRHSLLFSWVLLAPICARSASPAISVETRLLRIQQSIQQGDLDSAKRELEDLAKTGESAARIFNLRGVVDAQENRFSAAEENFRRATSIAPRFVAAYMNLGRLYQEHASEPGAPQKALDTYRRVLEFSPQDVEANYQAASLLTRAGKFAPSLAHLAHLPADARQMPAALALRCADYAGLGRTTEARVAAKELLSASGLAEADILPIVPVLSSHKAIDIAVSLLEASVDRGMASPAGLQALAGLQEKQGRLQQARESLERDLQLEPPSAAVLIQLGRLAYKSKDLEGALGYLAHARDLEPTNAPVHHFIGLICVDLKLPPEARQSLEEAVRLDPSNPYYNYALGAVLLQRKDPDAAISHFLKYSQVRPGDPSGRLALGVAYFDAYQLDAARRELELAARNPGTRSGGSLYLGRLALREDRIPEAVEHFRAAIQATPSAPDAYAELALAHIRRGEYTPAATTLARALKIAPDHYRSNLNLLMLYQRTKDSRFAEQARRVEELQQAGEERERMLLRSLDLRPY